MFKFRLKFALRTLLRNRSYTLLNVLGLALGLATATVIVLYLQSELSYDEHWKNHEDIYRVNSLIEINGQTEKFGGTGYGLAPLMADEYPGLEQKITRMYHIDQNIWFKNDQQHYFIEDLAIADENFLQVFNMELIAGSSQSALSELRSIVLSKSLADRFFPDQNAIGKTLKTNNFSYKVSGVFKDLPANSHHYFSALISAFEDVDDPAKIEELKRRLWQIDVHTFVNLKDKEVAPFETAFNSFYQHHMRPFGENLQGEYKIELTPVEKLHFRSGYQIDRASGNEGYLYAFGGIGILILALAAINYVNMATARGLKRIREIGIRKVLGSGDREIRMMMFTESILMSFISLFIALCMVEIVLEATGLNQVLNKDLSLDFLHFPQLLIILPLITLVIGILSGWYPAVSTSRLKGLTALKGGRGMLKTGIGFRRILVGFQFTASVAVVITALLMYRQMEFVKEKDLGFNTRDVVLINVQDTVTMNRMTEISAALENSPHVISSAMAAHISGHNTFRSILSLEADQGDFQKKVVDFIEVGASYFRTMEINVVDGYSFESKEADSVRFPVMVNEAMVHMMGWENPIGKEILADFDPDGNPVYTARIIGVTQDFNAHSLHQPIKPMVIYYSDRPKGVLHVRVDSEHLLAALDDIEKVWSKMAARTPFQFTFLNKDLMELYHSETLQSRLILYLTYLAIFISFLGLTGLASFNTSLRTKEIAIRKILGANLQKTIQLVFTEMLRLVAVSILVALPLALLMYKVWLKNFAYVADINPLVFIATAGVAIFLAYAIVSYHSYRVASAKAIDALKFE